MRKIADDRFELLIDTIRTRAAYCAWMGSGSYDQTREEIHDHLFRTGRVASEEEFFLAWCAAQVAERDL